MTDSEVKSLLDQVRTISAEHCGAMVFIACIEDQNGKDFTIRTTIGNDSSTIGMMEILKSDILHGHVIDKANGKNEEA